jgi:predicted transcriptional regulator
VKNWTDKKKELKSISLEEQERLDFLSDLICQIILKRKEKNLSQRDLSKLANVEQSTIARIETWQIKPSIETILKLLQSLDLKLEIKSKAS